MPIGQKVFRNRRKIRKYHEKTGRNSLVFHAKALHPLMAALRALPDEIMGIAALHLGGLQDVGTALWAFHRDTSRCLLPLLIIILFPCGRKSSVVIASFT
jgi:hypothetical protein